jgi:flagellar basal-body rod protein FlgC
MSIFDIYDTANNGLKTMRQVMEVSSQNVANMLTPGYKAKTAVISARSEDASFSTMLAAMGNDNAISHLLKGDHKGSGSQVAAIEVDNSPGAKIYMPNHPLADAEGNVEMSNVDGAGEMLKMMDAVRQYKANLSIVEMAKKASQEALNMTKNA